MSIRRCYRVVHIQPPMDAESNDYFLFKHFSGFWLIWKNTLASDKFQCDNFEEALHYGKEHALLRGRNLWVSLDSGESWEKNTPIQLKDDSLILKCS